MKNLSAINHSHFSRLFEITQSYNKATLLDKLIYWWQISTFTIPNDPHIWFTRSRERIAEESKLSLRTIDRYLDEFSKKGFIEKTNKLLIKKHLYIRITDKLLVFLGLQNEKSTNTKEKIIRTTITTKPLQMKVNPKTDGFNLEHIGSIDVANMAVSIYKDQNNNLNNNTVKKVCNVNDFENKKSNSTLSSDLKCNIKETINEQLTPQLSNYIKGVINNLEKQHGLKTSAPEQLYAEIVFSVLNKSHQFIGIEDNVHRLNLIAKLLRENRWRTPKGFFNNSASGKLIKHLMIEKDAEWRKIKKTISPNGNTSYFSINSQSNIENAEQKNIQQELQEVSRLLHTETCYYNEMKQRNEKKPSQMTQMVIDSTKRKLADLLDKKTRLQRKLKASNAA